MDEQIMHNTAKVYFKCHKLSGKDGSLKRSLSTNSLFLKHRNTSVAQLMDRSIEDKKDKMADISDKISPRSARTDDKSSQTNKSWKSIFSFRN